MENIESKWKHSIEKMSENELWSVLNQDEEYDNALLKFVHSKSKELFTPSTEETRYTIISILKELECPFQDEEEVINFEYEGEKFAFIVEEGEPFIQLLNLDMMTISMDNHNEVQLLKSAINAANYNCYVSLRYHIQWNEISAVGGANILFESFIPNRKELLQFFFAKFFEMKNYLKEEMIKQQYAEQPEMPIN